MCNACGNVCCGSDMFSGCGCDGCDCEECWSDDNDDDDDVTMDDLLAANAQFGPLDLRGWMAEIIGPSGRVHYRRPIGDPLIAEAERTRGYRVRYVDKETVEPVRARY